MEEKKIVKLQLNEFEMELILDALDLFRIDVEDYLEGLLQEKVEVKNSLIYAYPACGLWWHCRI